MKIIFILSAALVILSSCNSVKRLQKGEQLTIKPASLVLESTGDNKPVVDVDFELMIPENYAKGATQVIYQPQFLNTTDMYDLQPVVINSKRMARKEEKSLRRGNGIILPDAIRVISDDKPISIDYDILIPLEDWMPEAELIGWTVLNCCEDSSIVYNRDLIAVGVVVPEVEKPKFKEIITEVVSDIQVSESVYFDINNGMLDPKLDHNARSIEQVKELIADIKDDGSLELKSIYITGSASPDGTDKINDNLSKERAEIVANHLISECNISPDMIMVSATGANWEGFAEIVTISTLMNKSEVLAIAGSDKSDWMKTLELRKLPNYDLIKSEILPILRNVSCVFNLEKISEVIEIIEM